MLHMHNSNWFPTRSRFAVSGGYARDRRPPPRPACLRGLAATQPAFFNIFLLPTLSARLAQLFLRILIIQIARSLCRSLNAIELIMRRATRSLGGAAHLSRPSRAATCWQAAAHFRRASTYPLTRARRRIAVSLPALLIASATLYFSQFYRQIRCHDAT